MHSFRAACVQMESGDNLADNLARAQNLLAQAAQLGAQLAALPEFFTLLSADESAKLAVAEKPGDGPAQNLLAQAAKQHKMFILGGTIPIRPESPRKKTASTPPAFFSAPTANKSPDTTKSTSFNSPGRADNTTNPAASPPDFPANKTSSRPKQPSANSDSRSATTCDFPNSTAR